MYAQYLLPIVVFISMVLWIVYLSNKCVENFLFIDKSSDKVTINPDILQHTILLPNDSHKSQIEEQFVNLLCSKNESMLKNMIKYGDSNEWSTWISSDTENTHVNEINKQFFYYVKRKIEKTNHLKIILHKLDKYRYNIKEYHDMLFHYDIVCHDTTSKCAWYYQVLCVINIDSKKVHFLSIKLIGSISEDNIYISSNNENSTSWFNTPKHSDIDKLFDKDMMYQDNCLSMKTQDAQCIHVIYNKLMAVTDDSDDANKQNIQYAKNQQIVKNMFFNKLQGGFKEPNFKIKCYPYDNDFVLTYK
jgi:hypothetical protein